MGGNGYFFGNFYFVRLLSLKTGTTQNHQESWYESWTEYERQLSHLLIRSFASTRYNTSTNNDDDDGGDDDDDDDDDDDNNNNSKVVNESAVKPLFSF